jgi:hypothetical protein
VAFPPGPARGRSGTRKGAAPVQVTRVVARSPVCQPDLSMAFENAGRIPLLLPVPAICTGALHYSRVRQQSFLKGNRIFGSRFRSPTGKCSFQRLPGGVDAPALNLQIHIVVPRTRSDPGSCPRSSGRMRGRSAPWSRFPRCPSALLRCLRRTPQQSLPFGAFLPRRIKVPG